ncbi:MAG: AmmeMemoRadiSam system protein A [Candidatus Gracilibacteria bacterium]|jgi:AmmeMemoRadiSam system protein A
MGKEIKKYLLKLARKTIADKLDLEFELDEARPTDSVLNEKRGVFVTLELNHNLRGCIGNISPVYTLEDGVKRNAINAAFHDPRFTPLTQLEFDEIEIEISVLTVPKKLDYKNSDDLKEKLIPLKDGVIIKKGYYEATYLPQVWEDLADKDQFLSSLCMKAGLPPDEWQKGKLEVFTYQAEAFKEKNPGI